MVLFTLKEYYFSHPYRFHYLMPVPASKFRSLQVNLNFGYQFVIPLTKITVLLIVINFSFHIELTDKNCMHGHSDRINHLTF